MKEIVKEPIEKGSAEINVSLSKGIITVKHGECGSVLRSWVASGNDWDSLWLTIKELESNSVADDR